MAQTSSRDITANSLRVTQLSATNILVNNKNIFGNGSEFDTLQQKMQYLSEVSSDFFNDGMLEDVKYDAATKQLVFKFNADSDKDEISVDVSDLMNEYEAGEGIELSDNRFSLSAFIPVKLTDLENDAGFLSAHQSLSDYYTNTQTSSALEIAGALAQLVADKQDKITVDGVLSCDGDGNIAAVQLPTKVSEFQNDAGYLTAHQDISGKQDNLSEAQLSAIDSVMKFDKTFKVENRPADSMAIGNAFTSGFTEWTLYPVPNLGNPVNFQYSVEYDDDKNIWTVAIYNEDSETPVIVESTESDIYATSFTINATSGGILSQFSAKRMRIPTMDDLPTSTSQLQNDGEDGEHPFITLDTLSSYVAPLSARNSVSIVQDWNCAYAVSSDVNQLFISANSIHTTESGYDGPATAFRFNLKEYAEKSLELSGISATVDIVRIKNIGLHVYNYAGNGYIRIYEVDNPVELAQSNTITIQNKPNVRHLFAFNEPLVLIANKVYEIHIFKEDGTVPTDIGIRFSSQLALSSFQYYENNNTWMTNSTNIWRGSMEFNYIDQQFKLALATNIPTKVSELENDAGYLTNEDEPGFAEVSSNFLTAHQSLDDYATKNNINIGYNSETHIITLSAGNHTSTVNAADFIKDGMVNDVQYAAAEKKIVITFNTDAGKNAISVDVDGLVDTYTAGSGLTCDNNEFSLTASIPTKTSDLTNDSGYVQSSALTAYAQNADLTNYAQISNLTSYVSQTDMQLFTSMILPNTYAAKSDVNSLSTQVASISSNPYVIGGPYCYDYSLSTNKDKGSCNIFSLSAATFRSCLQFDLKFIRPEAKSDAATNTPLKFVATSSSTYNSTDVVYFESVTPSLYPAAGGMFNTTIAKVNEVPSNVDRLYFHCVDTNLTLQNIRLNTYQFSYTPTFIYPVQNTTWYLDLSILNTVKYTGAFKQFADNEISKLYNMIVELSGKINS